MIFGSQATDFSQWWLTLAGLEVSKPSNIEYIGSNFVNVPVIGEIACGEPITAEENISDYVPIPSDVVKDTGI